MRFLRNLARHNDRVWFEGRRALYERAARQPLHAVIEEINQSLADFAPDFVRPPHKVAMRIYRDIRFSPDKRPYKHNLGAWWSRRGMERTSAPGFYLQVGPTEVFVAAGIYGPERVELLAIRRWLAEHHQRYRETLAPLLKARGKQPALVPLDSNALTRNPKGFAPDDPASDLLRARNWGIKLPLAPPDAVLPGFGQLVAKTFERMLPLVTLLGEPFTVYTAADCHRVSALL